MYTLLHFGNYWSASKLLTSQQWLIRPHRQVDFLQLEDISEMLQIWLMEEDSISVSVNFDGKIWFSLSLWTTPEFSFSHILVI